MHTLRTFSWVCFLGVWAYAQNVGIGTATPQNRLHVDGPTPADANSGQLRISESGNGRYMLLGRAAGYGFIQTHNSQPLAINPLGNNVGIGTATPLTPLHVLRSVGNSWLSIAMIDGGANAPNLRLAVQSDNTHNEARAYLTVAGSGGAMWWKQWITNWGGAFTWSFGSAAGEKVVGRLSPTGNSNAGGTIGGVFSLHTATDAQVAGGTPSPILGAEVVRLNTMGNSWLNGGNVGIGTTGPTERLHVEGNLRLQGAFMPGNNAGAAGSLLRSAGAGVSPVWIAPGADGTVLTIASGLPAWSNANGLFWRLTGNSGTNPATNFLGTIDNQPLVIRTNNTERVRVTGGGYVGIGTATPALRLDVMGQTRIQTALIVTAADANEGGQIVLAGPGDYTADSENCNSWSADVVAHALGSRFRIFRGSIGCSTPGNLVEAFSILSNGNVGIDIITPLARLDVRKTAGHSAGTGANSDGPTTAIVTGSSTARYNDWPGGWGGGLSTWDIVGAGTYMSVYATRSDASFKTAVQPLGDQEGFVERFMRLRPVTYRFREDFHADEWDKKRLHYGFLANEVEGLFPDIVVNAGNDPSIPRGLEYDAFISMLVEMVQRHERRIQQLEERIAQLEKALQSR